MITTIIFTAVIITLGIIISKLFSMFLANVDETSVFVKKENETYPCTMDDYKFCCKFFSKN